MPSQDLLSYIKKAKEQNVADDVIKSQLLKAGWPASDVESALVPTPPPSIPTPPPPVAVHLGMWVGFLYVIFFISLYVTATSMGGLFHQWIDDAIKDPSKQSLSYSYTSNWDETLTKMYIASLVVAFPIFLSLALMLKRQIIKQPQVKNLRSRKILIYITLVGTFLIMIYNVITTVYGFLDGSLTLNSMGHVGVTLLVAGSIFAYFINEVKHDRN